MSLLLVSLLSWLLGFETLAQNAMRLSSIVRQAHNVLEHEAEAEGTLKGCVRVCRLWCRAAKLTFD